MYKKRRKKRDGIEGKKINKWVLMIDCIEELAERKVK